MLPRKMLACLLRVLSGILRMSGDKATHALAATSPEADKGPRAQNGLRTIPLTSKINMFPPNHSKSPMSDSWESPEKLKNVRDNAQERSELWKPSISGTVSHLKWNLIQTTTPAVRDMGMHGRGRGRDKFSSYFAEIHAHMQVPIVNLSDCCSESVRKVTCRCTSNDKQDKQDT